MGLEWGGQCEYMEVEEDGMQLRLRQPGGGSSDGVKIEVNGSRNGDR